MKIKLYKIFPMIALFAIAGCSDREGNLKIDEEASTLIDDEKILATSVHHIICKNIIVSEVSLKRDFSNFDKIGSVDSIEAKQVDYKYKKIFIYKNKGHADTLIYYKDSICKYNKQLLKFLGDKKMLLKNDSVDIQKYRYLHEGEKSKPANLYINKTLGLVTLQAGSQWRWVINYNRAYNDLHRGILRDSVFFSFEQEK